MGSAWDSLMGWGYQPGGCAGLARRPSPRPASRVGGTLGPSPARGLPGSPRRPETPGTALAPPPRPGLRRPPSEPLAPLPQPLCLCDPGGPECGNWAGGREAQRPGRGGVSARASSCLSPVWGGLWGGGGRVSRPQALWLPSARALAVGLLPGAPPFSHSGRGLLPTTWRGRRGRSKNRCFAGAAASGLRAEAVF